MFKKKLTRYQLSRIRAEAGRKGGKAVSAEGRAKRGLNLKKWHEQRRSKENV